MIISKQLNAVCMQNHCGAVDSNDFAQVDQTKTNVDVQNQFRVCIYFNDDFMFNILEEGWEELLVVYTVLRKLGKVANNRRMSHLIRFIY